jgi:hypothetical protein
MAVTAELSTAGMVTCGLLQTGFSWILDLCQDQPSRPNDSDLNEGEGIVCLTNMPRGDYYSESLFLL